MSIYEKKMFEYLTIRENYKSVKDIVRLIPEIDNQLRLEFWKEWVYPKIIELTKENNENIFIVDIKEDNSGYSQIRLFKESWKDVCVCYEFKGGFINHSEKVYYTIQLDKNRFRLNEFKESYKDYIDIEYLYNLNFENSSRWLTWRHIDYDFHSDEVMLRILPDVRELFAEELAEIVYKYANNVHFLCDKLSQNYKR